MPEIYLPNELVNIIYKQSIWLLIGDKQRYFKNIHVSIKAHTFPIPYIPCSTLRDGIWYDMYGNIHPFYNDPY
jgi:hypothetical protein